MKYRFSKHPSRLATVSATFGAGSRTEFGRQYPPGIAHFMEHVRFKGTINNSAKDLLYKMANAGGYWNAWTSNDCVSYHSSIPEENIETALECLSEVILHPIFPENELSKEKEVVCQEIRMYNDDMDSLVHAESMRLIFSNSMSIPIAGTEESVRSISRQNLIDYNNEFYRPDDMLLIVSAQNDVEHLVEKYFYENNGILVFDDIPKNVNYSESINGSIFKDGQLQNSVSICFGSPKLRDFADKNKAKIKVFSYIFGANDTSRLFIKVREELGLVYGIGSHLGRNMDGTYYEIYASTEPKYLNDVIYAINSEILKIYHDGITEDELVRAKNLMKSSYYQSLDSSYGAVSQIISEEFFNSTIGDKFIEEINAVTVDDVVDTINIIFNSNKYVVVGKGK